MAGGGGGGNNAGSVCRATLITAGAPSDCAIQYAPNKFLDIREAYKILGWLCRFSQHQHDGKSLQKMLSEVGR